MSSSFRRATAFATAAVLGATLAGARAEEAGPLPGVPAFLAEWDQLGRATVDEKGVTATLAGGDAKLIVGGRLHYDVGAAEVDPRLRSPALTSNGAIRRAWIEPQLVFSDGVALSLQYDFSNTATPINDALVSYKGAMPLIVAAGQFKEPFSIDQLQPNNSTLFTERSLLDTFAPGRDFGAVAGLHGERWTLAGGAFGGNVNRGLADDGVAGTARATYAPVLDEDRVVHFGLAASYRALDQRGTALSFADKPEASLFSTSLVNTGALRDAAAVGRVDAEFAAEWNPFRIQAEVARAVVSGAGAPDRTFSAAYVEGSWVINGHQRAYRLLPRYASEYGVFGGIEVPDGARVSRGGAGVFELGLRFSAVDLASGPVRGGAERDVTAGLNWYPDADIRFMADAVRARADPSAASVTGRPATADIFTGRIQVAW